MPAQPVSEVRRRLTQTPTPQPHRLEKSNRIAQPEDIQFWMEFLDLAAKKANDASEMLPESIRDCFEPCLLDALNRWAWSDAAGSKAGKSLSKRLSKNPVPASPSGLFNYPSGNWVVRLLQAWMGLPVCNLRRHLEHPAAKLYQFAIDRWTNGEQFSLISTPTHLGGWIDPRIWVERLNDSNIVTQTCEFDWALSLLRLSPDGRDEAWRDYQSRPPLPPAMHDLVSAALSADANVDDSKANPYAMLAALRSRDRNKVISLEVPWAASIRGPETRHPAEFVWALPTDQDPAYPDFPIVVIDPTVNIDSIREAAVLWFRDNINEKLGEVHSLSDLGHEVSEILFEMVRGIAADEYAAIDSSALPPVSLYANLGCDVKDLDNQHWDFGFAVFYRSLATLWPAELDWLWSRATRDFVYRSANGDAKTCFPEALLEPLRRPEVVMTRMAARLFWLGLGNKAKRVDDATINTLSSLVESHRLHLDLMVDVFVELRNYKGLNLKRIAESLDRVAERSSVHGLAVAMMIDGCLQQVDLKTRNYSALAAVALRGYDAAGEPASDRWVTQLENVKSQTLKQIASSLQKVGR